MLGIFDDIIPEIDENFDLRLTNPTGGVTLGTRQSVTVTVLNNDNAHGLIGFAEVLYIYTIIHYMHNHARPCDFVWTNLYIMLKQTKHMTQS